MRDKWITDWPTSQRFPHYTRANAGEVLADPVSPLGWSFGWDGGIVQGYKDGLIRIGAYEDADFDPEHPERPVVAAGAPWFMALFGRDSLLTSWMTMLVDPDLALGTLETLARFQGRTVDPRTEEEPGRILHEMRFGETATLELGGGRVYYGTADATPLFVMLVGELARWGTHADDVARLLPAADAALDWIDRFGDRDGDGYVEYLRPNDSGLENQGWKDSWDAMRYASGELASAPIALAEVQGYVYAALLAGAHLAEEADDPARAADVVGGRHGVEVADDGVGFAHVGADDAQQVIVRNPATEEATDGDVQPFLVDFPCVGREGAPADVGDVADGAEEEIGRAHV